MQSSANTVEQYVEELPKERQEPINKLRKEIKENLPIGFAEVMNYGMIGYVVPHDLYPKGYHCDPTLTLPFMGIASQKNAISVYHMGIYADEKLMDWFVGEYNKSSAARLDIGKSCIRFKKPENIPYRLIGKLSRKLTVSEWIGKYESTYRK